MKYFQALLWSGLAGLLLLSSCKIILPVNPNKQVNITQKIDLNSFTGIRLYTAANIEITEGPTYSIIATGPENIIRQLETATVGDDSILTFRYKQFYSNTKVDIAITMPNIQQLESFGSGNIIGQNTFKNQNLSIALFGTSTIDVMVDVAEVAVDLVGAGNVHLAGKTSKLNGTIKGVGHILAFDLNAENASLWSFGTGNMKAWAATDMDCGIYGTGSIYYRGHPTISSQIKGLGALVNAN